MMNCIPMRGFTRGTFAQFWCIPGKQPARSVGFLSCVYSGLKNSQHTELLLYTAYLLSRRLVGWLWVFFLLMIGNSENSQDFVTSFLSLKHPLVEKLEEVGTSQFHRRLFCLFSWPPRFKISSKNLYLFVSFFFLFLFSFFLSSFFPPLVLTLCFCSFCEVFRKEGAGVQLP